MKIGEALHYIILREDGRGGQDRRFCGGGYPGAGGYGGGKGGQMGAFGGGYGGGGGSLSSRRCSRKGHLSKDCPELRDGQDGNIKRFKKEQTEPPVSVKQEYFEPEESKPIKQESISAEKRARNVSEVISVER